MSCAGLVLALQLSVPAVGAEPSQWSGESSAVPHEMPGAPSGPGVTLEGPPGPGMLPTTGVLALSPEFVASWDERLRLQREVAWTRTLVSAGTGALAVAAGVEAWGARQEMNRTWQAYGAASPGDAAVRFEAFRSARASWLGWSGASLAATLASAWTGLQARAAWRELDVQPVVDLRRGAGSIGVKGRF